MFDARKKGIIKETALALFGADAETEVSDCEATVSLNDGKGIFAKEDSRSVTITNYEDGRYGFNMHYDHEFTVDELKGIVEMLGKLESCDAGGETQEGGR